MRRSVLGMLIGTMGMWGLAGGCASSPPPPVVMVPAPGYRDTSTNYQAQTMKPLPEQPPVSPADYPPFEDVPLLSQQLPEQPAFVDAYRKVGSPRIMVVVDRTTDAGQKGGLGTNDVDFDAIESILTDWISCNGQVTILAHNQNSPQQNGADILVNIRAQTTRQTATGRELRLVGQAVNTRGGEQIAQVVVDVPPPLEKTTINRYTRFVARKLMDGMLNTWSAAPPETPPTPASLLPSTQPASPTQGTQP